MNKSKYLQVAIDAALQAQEVIMKHFAGEITYETKSDLSPVTIADKQAEEIIIKTIKESFPDHGFLGEESGEESNNSEYQWIIDPIDGTKNFSRHIPLFATQIALLKDGEIIIGVSNAPALNELIYAEKGFGAYINNNRLEVSDIKTLDKSYFCFGGLKYFQKYNLVDQLFNLVHKTLGHRGIGDFWCYHLLSQGKIDIMIEAESKIWDFAALKVIVEEAGGKVTDVQGNEINKNSTSVVATNLHLHEQVLDSLA